MIAGWTPVLLCMLPVAGWGVSALGVWWYQSRH